MSPTLTQALLDVELVDKSKFQARCPRPTPAGNVYVDLSDETLLIGAIGKRGGPTP